MSRFRPHASLRDELSGSSRNKLASFSVIAGLVLVVGVVAGLLYWQFFGSRSFEAAELAPIDTELFMKLEWREDSQQNINLNDISLDLGGITTVDGFLNLMIGKNFGNSEVKFRQDIAPWLGKDVAIVRRNLEIREEEVNIFSVGDKTQKDAFLARLERESDTVGKEMYKGYEIHSVFGKSPVSFAEVGNTVVLAAKPQAVKYIIDVAAKDIEPLTKAPDYKLTQKNLDKEVLFTTFVDVAPFFRAPSNLGVDPGVAINLEGQARMGITLAAKEEGFGAQIFIPEVTSDGKMINDFNADIIANIPNNVAGYFGSTNLSNFVSNYLDNIFSAEKLKAKNITKESLEQQYGISINDDLLSLLKGEYSVVYMDQQSDDFSIIFKVENGEDASAKMKKLENAIIGVSKALSAQPENIPNEFSGSSNGVRYLQLGGKSNYFLNYVVKDDKLILATSREALDKIIVPDEKSPTLPNSKQYELVAKGLPEDNGSGTLYLQGQILIDFVKQLGFDFSFFERHVVGLGFKSVNTEDGRMLTGYLPII